MIFLFGTRTVHLKSVENKNAVCASCNKQGSMVMSIYRNHFHMFWIPMFALGKKGFTECIHCKNVLRQKEMPVNLKNELDIVKKEAKGPIWQYAGLLFMLAIVLFIVVVSIIN